jgi:hypothetical protein
MFDALQISEPDYTPGQTISQRFEVFHECNPQVYQALRQMALGMRKRGRKHYGMKGLFEKLRFDHAMQTVGDESFKLNNNYTALYARLLMESEPQLAGFFETRQRRGE